MPARALYLLIVAISLLSEPAMAQRSSEAGVPYLMRRYLPEDYGLHNQNWAIAQDARGVLYVGNTAGLLEYDGGTWRTIEVPGEAVRSVTASVRGVFLGGIGEIGHLVADTTGELQYQSLTPHVPEADRAFGDVWNTYAVGDAVFFQSFSHLFRWWRGEMTVWKPETRYHALFKAGESMLVREEGRGLLQLAGDSWDLVPGGARFAGERIDGLARTGDAVALILTRTQGLARLSRSGVASVDSEAEAYFRTHRAYSVTTLGRQSSTDGLIAVGTVGGGLVLLNRQGGLVATLRESIGLTEADFVLDVFEDHQGGLWLALSDGILHVNLPTPLTWFGRSLGLVGAVNDVTTFGGGVYVSTSTGLYRLVQGTSTPVGFPSSGARFQAITGIDGQCWSLAEVGGALLAACSAGVYEVGSGSARQIYEGAALSITQSSRRRTRAYVGLRSGYVVVERGAGGWATRDGRLPEVSEVRRVVETASGLWVTARDAGLIHIAPGTEPQAYGPAEGLPDGLVHVHEIGGRLVFQTADGLYRLRETPSGSTFVPDATFNEVLEGTESDHLWLNPLGTDRLAVLTGQGVRLIDLADGPAQDRTPPALQNLGLVLRAITQDTEGALWIGTEEGLIRYDPEVGAAFDASYSALIRRVSVQGEILFGGVFGEGVAASVQGPGRTPRLSPGTRDLRFTFAAASFYLPRETRYQYLLEGFDETWSAPTAETFKEYSNLPEGSYVFRVRAINAQGAVSREGSYEFEIAPPWHRTLWFYLLFVAGLGVIVTGYVRLRTFQHRKQLDEERMLNQRLERLNERLGLANDRLREADKLKDDFLANTSHELRTPLTAILGFSEILLEDGSEEQREFAGMIHRSGERLLETVNSLLDMAKLQAGMIEVQPEDADLIEIVRESVDLLRPLAAEKGLVLATEADSETMPVRVDRFALDRIITNLVSNAIKFTSEGGVRVRMAAVDDRVAIVVEDTGIGIEEAFLPHLFDAFKQASRGYARRHEGSGLGLSITKRIVQILGGEIDVRSKAGQGTAFRVLLPRFDRRARGEAVEARTASPWLDGAELLVIVRDQRAQEVVELAAAGLCGATFVTSKRAALEAAKRQPFDAILIEAPLDDLAIARARLKALRGLIGYANTPIGALTDGGPLADDAPLLDMGFDGHARWPMGERAVVKLLETLLVPSESEVGPPADLAEA